MRVMVTGSRNWERPDVIRSALVTCAPPGSTIVHGATRGADLMAAEIAEELGYELDPYPANWRPGGIYNPLAGFERNLRMLDSGIERVVAFHRNHSPGTAHAIQHALDRDIATRAYQMADGWPGVRIRDWR